MGALATALAAVLLSRESEQSWQSETSFVAGRKVSPLKSVQDGPLAKACVSCWPITKKPAGVVKQDGRLDIAVAGPQFLDICTYATT